MTTHKRCHGFEYQAWKRMIQNCTNPNSHGWANCGAKGISVGKEFKDFISFYEIMGDMPETCNTLLRISDKGDFIKENTRWGYVARGRPRGSKKIKGKKRKHSKFKNPKVLAVTIEGEHLEYIRKQALQISLQKGEVIECNDLVREALQKAFPLPSHYDMFGGNI